MASLIPGYESDIFISYRQKENKHDGWVTELVDCLGEVTQYIYKKHGKFPGTFSTIVLPGYVQTLHPDNEYYDTFYKTGA